MSPVEEIERVPDTAIHCPRCETASLPNRKFCAKCGAALWEPCLRCGEPCAADERFCGACGAQLAELAAEQIEQAEAALCAAAEMRAACRFDEAIALLTPIAKKSHPRLAEYTARARQLTGRLADEHRRQRLAADEAQQRADRCLAACDYDGAAELLDGIPMPLQDDDVRQLRAKIAEQQQEIDSLAAQLRDDVHQNRVLDLPARIEQLLALKPDHPYVRTVAAQVQSRLVAVAKKMLAEHRYDQALDLLDRISVWSDTSNFQRLYQQTAELAWLDGDMRNAPVIDKTLVAVAERLRRLAPGNARAVRLHDELQRRIRVVEPSQRLEPLPWARPPAQTPLGVPVDWLAGFRRLSCAEARSAAELSRHPGRFAVACGLALAGIKQAVLRIDLLSAQELGLLRRVKYLMQPQTTQSAWGIDMGGSSLKAVKLAWNKAKQQATVEAVTLVEHAKPLSHAVNAAEETKIASDTLKAFLSAQQITTERVCVGLPGRMTLSRQIELPPVDQAKAAKLIQFEAAHQLPFPLEQLVWDFQVLDDLPGAGGTLQGSSDKGCRALLIAAKRASAQHFLDAFERRNLRIDVLQPDFVALHNFLAHDYFAAAGNGSAAETGGVVAALDVGCNVTNVIVSSPQSLWFHSCGVAGQTFTRALVKEFNLTTAQAEQRKRTPEEAERLSEIYEALSPVFDDLLTEVQQSLAAYAKSQPDRPVERVVALGGGFCLHGLFRHLRCRHVAGR
jgi:type IV pilus assembly protein PilM